MENCFHWLVIADTFRVAAAHNAMQSLVERNGIFLYYPVVAYDIYLCLGGNEGYFVHLFLFEEIVGNFDNALFPYFLA